MFTKAIKCFSAAVVVIVSAGIGSGGCSAAESATPEDAAESTPDLLSTNPEKRGLLISGSMTTVVADGFQGKISWMYNYGTSLPPEWITWANQHHVEFVPMIWGRSVTTSAGTSCTFRPNSTTPQCTLADVVGALSTLKTKLTVTPRFLMGANEPWSTTQSNLTPWEAAEDWRAYIQPAAAAAGYQTVTPNTSYSDVQWLASFLERCHDKATDPVSPCRVEEIKAFAVHEYDCHDSYFDQRYGSPSKLFKQKLKDLLGTYGGKKDWAQYVDARRIWVTEHNCNWEWEEVNNPDSREQCLRITGQSPTHGIGSVKYMMNNSEFDRLAWFLTTTTSTTNENLIDAALSYPGGTKRPVGRGYYRPEPGTDCSW